MKRIALFTSLFALACAAAAQTSPSAAAPATLPAASGATAIGPEAVESPQARAARSDSNCLTHTGSRVSSKPDRKGRKCINAAGRAYDREDIERTGATDLRDALRRLDPAVH